MTKSKSFDIQDRTRTRERLKKEKPILYQKFLELDQKLSKGETPPPVIEIAYKYDCNFRCQHCFAGRFIKKEKSLSLKDLGSLVKQAQQLGVYQFILQGGEPLFWPDFDKIIAALKPKEFYLGLVTNASLLNKEKAKHLRKIGIDKIVISLDSYDELQYEENRNRPGAFNHTVDMLFKAKEAGLRVVINTVVTKQNVRDPQLLKLVEFAKKNGFIVYVNFATAIGNWEGRYDLLLDKSDADYIYDLNCQHEVIKRDIFPYKGIKVGCPALRSVVYITQYGDVLPCPFIHISVGNILNEPLAKILKRGRAVKWFNGRSSDCLASENMDFIKNKVAKTYGKPSPVDMNEVFTKDELTSL